MKAKINMTIILCSLIIVCMVAGCNKIVSCGCTFDYPEMYDHYSPYTISWTYFNPILRVQEYFYHHDSTLRAHDGDTIMLSGNVSRGPETPNVYSRAFMLQYTKEHSVWGECANNCFPSITILMPEDRFVEEWMTQENQVVFVKGIIRNRGYEQIWNGHDGFVDGDRVDFRIEALQIDSVKF